MSRFPPLLCDTVTLPLPVRSFTVSAGEFPAVSQAVMEQAGRNDCAAMVKRSWCRSEVLRICAHGLLPARVAGVHGCWTLNPVFEDDHGKVKFLDSRRCRQICFVQERDQRLEGSTWFIVTH